MTVWFGLIWERVGLAELGRLGVIFWDKQAVIDFVLFQNMNGKIASSLFYVFRCQCVKVARLKMGKTSRQTFQN